ncbi:MAG: hypothetical protein QME90_01125 [Thermodesulfobacteriota bacterium]|nr:hypothetical protein [Thermodesulfobacteriota bacterium]
MEAIHLKTVDPISQYLLRSAAQQGTELLWERYEKLQPQDGFLRLGLSCPYGCMQGPCRIDPFGRGSDRGLCGLNKDGMVAAFLLRLTLHGVLELMNDFPNRYILAEKQGPSSLDEMFGRSLKNLGNRPLSLKEIHHSAFLLHRPWVSPEHLVEQALRLGILSLKLSGRGKRTGKVSGKLGCKVGYGLLSGRKIFIGVSGNPSPKLVSSLFKEASRETSPPVQILSLGSWIPLERGFLPFGCTSGEAELLLSCGSIHLLLAGVQTPPSLLEFCGTLKIPFVMAQDGPKGREILGLARQRFSTGPQAEFISDPSLVQESRVAMAVQDLKDHLKTKKFRKLAVVGGSDTPQQPMGWLPVELAKALLGEDYQVAGWGDAALWMMKDGLASKERDNAIAILDEKQGPLLALRALTIARRLEDLKGVCFTGLKSCRDLAVALGLASLGMKVCVADPLPLWGSEKIRNLLAEKMMAAGGGMTHFDHPASPQEILEWFLK